VKRIAVVEDEVECAALYKRFADTGDWLFAGHVELVLMPGLKECMAYLAHNRVDALVIDLTLSSPSGTSSKADTIEFIREKSATLPPIIVLTASEDIATRKECFAAGAEDFFWKPDALTAPKLFFTASVAISREPHRAGMSFARTDSGGDRLSHGFPFDRDKERRLESKDFCGGWIQIDSVARGHPIFNGADHAFSADCHVDFLVRGIRDGTVKRLHVVTVERAHWRMLLRGVRTELTNAVVTHGEALPVCLAGLLALLECSHVGGVGEAGRLVAALDATVNGALECGL